MTTDKAKAPIHQAPEGMVYNLIIECSETGWLYCYAMSFENFVKKAATTDDYSDLLQIISQIPNTQEKKISWYKICSRFKSACATVLQNQMLADRFINKVEDILNGQLRELIPQPKFEASKKSDGILW